MISIIGMYILFALTFIIGKKGLLYAQPLFFIGVRMIIGGGILFGYYALKHRSTIGAELKSIFTHRTVLILFGAVMLVHIYLPYTTEYCALQHMAPAKTALVYNLTPFITALVAFQLFGDRLTKRKLIGMMIGFCGFLPTLLTLVPEEGKSLLHISTAEWILLFSVGTSVYGWMLVKLLLHRHKPLLLINGLGMFGGGILSLITSWFVEPWTPIPVTEYLPFCGWLIALVLIGNIICYNVYGYLLHRYSITLISLAGFTCPLATAVLQRLFFNEVVHSEFYISLVLVAIGLCIFYRDELKEEKIPVSIA